MKIKKALQKKWVQQLVFWLVAYFILLNIFAIGSVIQPVDRIYTFIFVFTLFVPVIINLYYLMPAFLHKKAYVLFFV